LLSERSSEAILYAIKRCHGECKIYFNPGAPNLINKNFEDVIRLVDVLIMNEGEAKALTGKNELNDAREVLKEIVNLAVITMGKKGCAILRSREVVHVKGEEINVLDTTGAGDTFAAGFIVGKLRGLSDVECAKLGNKVAAKFLKKRAEALK
jgi:sugar/nucleoside kinase (ribokinase family)